MGVQDIVTDEWDNWLCKLVSAIIAKRDTMTKEQVEYLDNCAHGDYNNDGSNDEPEDYYTPYVFARILAHKDPSEAESSYTKHVNFYELYDLCNQDNREALNSISHRYMPSEY